MPLPAIPEGFRQVPPQSGFLEVNGPLYYRIDEDAQLTLGLLIERRHCNAAQNCHGAMVAGFADFAMGLTSMLASDPRKLVFTVSLTCDFLATVPVGSWMEGRATQLRRTKTMAFAQAIMTASDQIVARASGIFRVPEADTPGLDLARLLQVEDRTKRT
jgi:acyl-coenzyme A thioesterase 13